jgi:hypothetical protein
MVVKVGRENLTAEQPEGQFGGRRCLLAELP